ncbi:hypothetical protein [Wolbachia endosymbiont (group B) of Gerris lacustris]|uniref:hypothetical protein n=1 Tax=Wolbachia endosymbiont (group B) of Gerris lacustris TaxID=3066159 RepID=UPI003978D6F5
MTHFFERSHLKHFHINPKGIAIIRIYGVLTKKTEAFDHILDMTSYENIHEEIESALEPVHDLKKGIN